MKADPGAEEEGRDLEQAVGGDPEKKESSGIQPAVLIDRRDDTDSGAVGEDGKCGDAEKRHDTRHEYQERGLQVVFKNRQKQRKPGFANGDFLLQDFCHQRKQLLCLLRMKDKQKMGQKRGDQEQRRNYKQGKPQRFSDPGPLRLQVHFEPTLKPDDIEKKKDKKCEKGAAGEIEEKSESEHAFE